MSSTSNSKDNSLEQDKRSTSLHAARTNLPQDRRQGNKIFVTNLLGSQTPKKWDGVIRSLFTPHYTKCSYDNSYCYSFVEVQDDKKVPQLIAKFNGYLLEGRKITVQRQNSGKRSSKNWSLPKGSLSKNDGKCFKCNKTGHIARFCSQQQEQQKSPVHRRHKNRSREKSRERKIDKKKDSIIARGRTRGKEQRKKRSRHRHLNDSSDSSQPSSSSCSLDSYRSNSSEKRRKKDKRSKERRDKKRKHRKQSHKKKKHHKRVERSSSSSSASPSPTPAPLKKLGKKEQK